MTTELPIVRLPSLAGRQRESWRALIELAPNLGAHWLLIGGQMVFLHEVERGVSDMRPTDDVDLGLEQFVSDAVTVLGHPGTGLQGSFLGFDPASDTLVAVSPTPRTPSRPRSWRSRH